MTTRDDLHTFLDHWHTYRDAERRLSELCHRAPLDGASVTEGERRILPLEEPASARYDEAYLQQVVTRVMTSRLAPAPLDEPQWGWWLHDEAWANLGAVVPLLEELGQARAHEEALTADRAAALAADDRCQEQHALLVAYATANEKDAEQNRELTERRDHLEEAYDTAFPTPVTPPQGMTVAWGFVALAVATLVLTALPLDLSVRAGIACAWLASALAALVLLWPRAYRRMHKRRWQEKEREHIDRMLFETTERIDRRAKASGRARDELTTLEAELAAPFEEPLSAARAAVEGAERAVVSALAQDIAARSPSFDVHTWDEVPFDEALCQAAVWEWALLDAWMDAYRSGLPAAIEQTEQARSSESVWLDGHQVISRRHWDRADDIAEMVDSGAARNVDDALAQLA